MLARARPAGCVLTVLSLLALGALIALGYVIRLAAGFNDNGNPESAATLERAYVIVGCLGWGAVALTVLGLVLAFWRPSERTPGLQGDATTRR